ncbi:hypothetical protein BJ165DRAFT_1493734, partial [Panaeolus papilionaceus]
METEADEDRMADRSQLELNKTRSPDEISSRRVLLCSEAEFMQYCFMLTKRGPYDVAEGILRHIM